MQRKKYETKGDIGCFPLCQRFRKFRLEFKWKGPFRFLLTGIFGITSGGGPHISVGIFRPKFAVPFLTNRFFALIRESGRRIWNDKSRFYWLAQFYRKMSFHFPQVFPLISDRSIWHNGKHPYFLSTQAAPKSSPTISVRPRSSVARVTVDLIRRSWVRFPPKSKDFFFTSCGSLIPFTRANAQWVIHGFKFTHRS